MQLCVCVERGTSPALGAVMMLHRRVSSSALSRSAVAGGEAMLAAVL